MAQSCRVLGSWSLGPLAVGLSWHKTLWKEHMMEEDFPPCADQEARRDAGHLCHDAASPHQAPPLKYALAPNRTMTEDLDL